MVVQARADRVGAGTAEPATAAAITQVALRAVAAEAPPDREAAQDPAEGLGQEAGLDREMETEVKVERRAVDLETDR